jgi:molybdate transport system substrate-binding protein
MQLHLLTRVIAAAALVLGAGWGCRQGERASAELAPAADTGASDVLQIYAPCGMEAPFMELEALFEQAHPGVEVNLLLDNAHILVERVIDKGERPDIVISPGGHELTKMAAAGLIKPADLHPFSPLDLCLFVPRANTAGVNAMDDLLKDSVKVLAVADPEKTSIGHYTVEALKKAGLWDRLQSKVVITGDASMTYKHVASGKADASFAYRSCPLKTAPDKLEYSKVRVIQSVPGDLYGPAYATVAVLTGARRRDLAEQYVALAFSAAGREILAKFDMPCLPQVGGGSGEKQP